MNLKTQVVSGVKWTTISTIVLAATAILKISVLARFLDKSDFGLMAMIGFVMGFMELFNDMGITTAILHKRDVTKKEYASLYWFNLMLSIGIYFLLLLITPLVADFYRQGQLNTLIPLLGLNLIISAFGRQFKIIEQKELLFKFISITDIVAAMLSFAFAVILAVNGFGVLALVYSLLLQFAVSNIILLIIGLKKYGLLLHYKFAETKPFLKIGGYYVGGQVANYFNRDLDVLLIGRFFSSEILGGYSLAKQLVFRPAQLINPILSKVASPILAKFQADKSLLKQSYLKLINIVSTINIPIYALIIIFAPWIVNILYGNGFDNIVVLVRILSIYMIFRAIGNPVGSLVVATGRTDLEFMWNLLTLFVMPVFIYAGVQYGIVEVTMLITAAMVILFVPSWRFLIYRMVDISLWQYFRACFSLNFKLLGKAAD